MDAYRVEFNTWQEKTEWVQKDKRFDVLLPWGKHRADVLKEYIDHLEAKCAALASLEAEPVSVPDEEQRKPHPVMAVKGELGFLDHFERIIDERDDDIEIGRLSSSNGEALMLAALDAFRAAMLQGANGNSQWVACSERMPEKGRTLALFGKRIKEVCANYVDEGYIGDDGEFYFFDWEGGPRIDDCHPYDKAIVTHWMYWELPAAPKGEHRDA